MNSPITDNLDKATSFAGERIGAAGEQVRETAHAAREATEHAYNAALHKAEEAYSATRAKASEAYETSRRKANAAYARAQKGVKSASRRTSQELQDNPLAFLVGGAALGALIGALLPRTETEKKALGTAGKKINQSAAEAARAAKAAGQKKLDSLGISKDAARSGVETLLKSVVSAASEAGSAATKTVVAKTRKR